MARAVKGLPVERVFAPRPEAKQREAGRSAGSDAGRGQALVRAGEAGTGLGLRRRGERAGEEGGERSAGT